MKFIALLPLFVATLVAPRISAGQAAYLPYNPNLSTCLFTAPGSGINCVIPAPNSSIYGISGTTSAGTGSTTSIYSIWSTPSITNYSPTYFGTTASRQSTFASNAFYNGTSWVQPTANSASIFRLNGMTQIGASFTFTGGEILDLCPVQNAGSTITGADSTCIARTSGTGTTTGGVVIHRAWLNSQTPTQVAGNAYTGTPNIGTDSSLTINTPATIDNAASTLLAANSASDKGLVVQGAASQSANLQEWQNSTGASSVFIGPDGSLEEKDTTNGHVYRIVITNGAITLQQVS